MYIQVNIGRNIGTTPMILSSWDLFVSDVCNIIDGNREHSDMGGDDMPSVHRGQGIWDGVREDSAHISMYHEGGFDVESIRDRLAELRDYYGQDSIALIVGSELI